MLIANAGSGVYVRWEREVIFDTLLGVTLIIQAHSTLSSFALTALVMYRCSLVLYLQLLMSSMLRSSPSSYLSPNASIVLSSSDWSAPSTGLNAQTKSLCSLQSAICQ